MKANLVNPKILLLSNSKTIKLSIKRKTICENIKTKVCGLFLNFHKKTFPRLCLKTPLFPKALYITDMPTTAAWIDHAFGYYHQVFPAFLVEN